MKTLYGKKKSSILLELIKNTKHPIRKKDLDVSFFTQLKNYSITIKNKSK